MSGNNKMDLIQQNAIHVETIRKWQKHQKLHTEFSINPHRKCKSNDYWPRSNSLCFCFLTNYVSSQYISYQTNPCLGNQQRWFQKTVRSPWLHSDLMQTIRLAGYEFVLQRTSSRLSTRPERSPPRSTRLPRLRVRRSGGYHPHW